MESFYVSTLDELFEVINSYRTDGFSPYLTFYRGESKERTVKCGLARNQIISIDSLLKVENEMFNEFYNSKEIKFCLQKHSQSNSIPFSQNWLNLFQAQHLGLKTRLLDFTQSKETALYFVASSSRNLDCDGVLWVYKCPYNKSNIINFNEIDDTNYFQYDPFKLSKTLVVKHYTIFNDDFENAYGEILRFRQDGSFILFSETDILKSIDEIEHISSNIDKIIISSSLKNQIINEFLVTSYADYVKGGDQLNESEMFKRIENEVSTINSRFIGESN
jgi:hypothetical protein